MNAIAAAEGHRAAEEVSKEGEQGPVLETGGESNSVTTNDTNDHNNEGQEDPTKQ